MHYIHEIDKWTESELLSKLKSKKFKETDRYSGSMAAEKTLENHYLSIRVVCERGVFDIEVGPKGKPNMRWSVSFIKDLLEPAFKGRWNLNLNESLDFITKHYDWLIENFSKDKFRETNEKIEERCRQTF